MEDKLQEMIKNVQWNIDWHQEKLNDFKEQLAVLESKTTNHG